MCECSVKSQPGLAGPAGDTGDPGMAGEWGQQGDQGDAGPKGVDGVLVSRHTPCLDVMLKVTRYIKSLH